MDNAKVYVEVVSVTRPDGMMLPHVLVWEDGQKYRIDRVSDIRLAASLKAGGQGDRYTIWGNGQERYLFFERNRSLTGNNLGR